MLEAVSAQTMNKCTFQCGFAEGAYAGILYPFQNLFR